MNKSTISTILLTHNDESIIARCLKSVAWCDEIIVIDDYSDDTTVAVARKHDAQIFKKALHDDFAAQRNFGLNRAKSDWVLFIDSDEIVSPQLRDEIKRVIQQDEAVGYTMKRRDFLFGKWLKHGETVGVELLRLARKNVGSWKRPVHETWEVKGAVLTLQAPLLHYPHATIAEFLASINRYTTINARVFKDDGVTASWFEIFVYPAAKFINNFIFRAGFLDGTAGFIVAALMSFHSFLTRAKLYFLTHDQKDHI